MHKVKLKDMDTEVLIRDVFTETSKLNGSEKKEGLRFNEGKLRYDLVHPRAHEGLVKVLTAGSKKYAERNWEKGMKWSSVIASLKRHLAAIERGEDFDKETGLLHIDHVQCNAHFLSAYYKIAPQYDDRQHSYLNHPKISLDLDDCIIEWCKTWSEKFNHPIPKCWHFSYKTGDNFNSFSKEELEDFYLNIPAKVKPEELEFDIHCYLTARSIDENITKQWIENNGFPTRPVHSVGFGESKVQKFIESGADWHIDDGYHNFLELTKAGIPCFLLTTPHNEKYDVGFKRIKDFADFKERFL